MDSARRAAQQAIDDLQAAAEEIVRLEGQLAELGGRSDTAPAVREHVIVDTTPSIGDRDLDIPQYLRRFLGPQPVDPERRSVWNEAANLIEDYRKKWGITTTRSVLGAHPDDPQQLADRVAVVEGLRELVDKLRRAREARESARDEDAPARAQAPFEQGGLRR